MGSHFPIIIVSPRTIMQIKTPLRYLFIIRLACAFILLQFLVRTIFLFENLPGLTNILKVYTMGLLWDGKALVFLTLPLLVLSILLPQKFLKRFESSWFSKIAALLLISFMTSISFCELTFWNEFHSRFNFIAVDYLIYTNEVLANIRESYPIHLIFPLLIIIGGLLTFMVYKIPLRPVEKPFSKRPASLLLFTALLPLLHVYGISPLLESAEDNFHRDQLARNGWVEFFQAFRSNEIDYKAFYATIPDAKARSFVTNKRISQDSKLPFEIPGKPNIVMIVVESLGAKFIAPLGGQKETTPFLNQLSEKAIFFENLYSTGTRTVRGLEAINLSVPPTPGYAVVKRPEHKNLYSLGNTFASNGYDPIFLYGGMGYFDNMNSFFEGNKFQTIDQTDFNKEEITFSNAWGVCDEDLFQKAIKLMDVRKSPTLLFMLTTSNHRPFTYPDGKIDIPSGESRAGAVKYTDYAIGKFLKEAETKPWAKNTIFVIVADHSTEGRGRFELEMSDFHIPMWIYAPQYLKPQKIKKLVSQIDLLPSLVHLLGLKDDSPFFGKSFFNPTDKEERAFIGNYQYVGYFKGNTLTTLGPNRKVKYYSYDPIKKTQKDLTGLGYVEEAISYYQYASKVLSSGSYVVRPTI